MKTLNLYKLVLLALLLTSSSCDSKSDLNPIESCRMPEYNKYEFSSLQGKPTIQITQNEDKTVTLKTTVTNNNAAIFSDGSLLEFSNYDQNGVFKLTEIELQELATKELSTIFGLSMSNDDFRKNFKRMSLCYYETYLTVKQL